jgi:hypothetical protein
MSFLAGLLRKKPEEKKPAKTAEANNAAVPNNLLRILGITREQYMEQQKAKRLTTQLKEEEVKHQAEVAQLMANSARMAAESGVAVNRLAGKKAFTNEEEAELAALMQEMRVAAGAPAAGAAARPRSPTFEELEGMPKAEQNAYYERKLKELVNSSGGRRRSTRRQRRNRRRSTRRHH